MSGTVFSDKRAQQMWETLSFRIGDELVYNLSVLRWEGTGGIILLVKYCFCKASAPELLREDITQKAQGIGTLVYMPDTNGQGSLPPEVRMS